MKVYVVELWEISSPATPPDFLEASVFGSLNALQRWLKTKNIQLSNKNIKNLLNKGYTSVSYQEDNRLIEVFVGSAEKL